jgi:prolyl-tRNA editing enzyme YbaK/EbsC (Cys-tRNA(Pro) deacylase)
MATPAWLHVYRHQEVISCVDAARARGIDLAIELKTLLLRVRRRIVAVHLRGDRRLDNRRLRRLFGVRISFVPTEELVRHGLRPGTINPWNVPFCHAHVISASVLVLPQMATNNSLRDEGVLFDTSELRKLRNVVIAEVESE